MLRPKPDRHGASEHAAQIILGRRLYGEDRAAWLALAPEVKTKRAQQLIACGDPWLVTRDIIREDIDRKDPFYGQSKNEIVSMIKKEDPHLRRRLKRLENF